jgi:WD40 repeat protein
MTQNQLDDDMSGQYSSSEEESEVELKPAPRKPQQSVLVEEKDSDEEELERLVLGNKASFREQLFRDNDVFDYEATSEGNELQLVRGQQDHGLEEVDDADIFFIDIAPGEAGVVQPSKPSVKAQDTSSKDAPVWEDSDDERLSISLANATRLRKLRVSEDDDIVSGTEYSRRLRQQFIRLNPVPAWALESEKKTTKRRRRSSVGSDSSSSGEEGDEPTADALPLEKLLRDVRQLAGANSSKKRRLRPEVLDIQRTRDIPTSHKAPINTLCFHPKYSVLLSSSASSVLYLHQIAPTAHPTPNPKLISVHAKQVSVRRSQFLSPNGQKVFFAGRRRYFHSWDLETGLVQKTSQILGHELEHKSMEHFKLSPCGRYMALQASTRKGGGILNILSVTSMQWIAAARLDGRSGIADFCWWSTGDGITILGKDGRIGEYSMISRRFIASWYDEGCVGGIVIALGGHSGPSLLGEDAWVAVGSNSGITNIYNRSELVASQNNGEIVVKERPEPTKRFEQLVTPITVLTFSPDGQLLAFGSKLKKDAFRLVHLPSCTVYRNWPTDQTPLGRVTAVAFSSGSDVLAVGNDSGKIRLWEIRG